MSNAQKPIVLPTPEEQERIKTDPVYFINEWLGMPLHKGQVKYIERALQGVYPVDGNLLRRFILSCGNRYGKSVLISCLQLWYLWNKFGIRAESTADWMKAEYRTANIAPTSKLTQPVFKTMKAIMTSSFAIRNPETGIIRTNRCKIEWFLDDERTINNPPYKLFFVNNSYIEHLSLMGNKGDSLQGLPYGIITYDEAPRSDHLEIEIDDAILGRLMDWTAPLHLLGTSTQTSASILYYNDIYQEGLVGLNQTYTQEGSLYDNEFLTKEQIHEQEKLVEHSPLKDQILYGKFIFGTRNIFALEDIQAAQDESLDNGVRREDGHRYVFGIDTAIGKDEFSITVLDVTTVPYRTVWTDAVKGNSRSPQMHLNTLINLVEAYREGNNIEILLETWNGESARFYLDLPDYIKAFTHCYGAWQPPTIKTDNDNPVPSRTATIKKADIVVTLNKALADHKLKIPKSNRDLIRQLSIYREEDSKLPTDRVISLALAVWLPMNNAQRAPVEFVTIQW